MVSKMVFNFAFLVVAISSMVAYSAVVPSGELTLVVGVLHLLGGHHRVQMRTTGAVIEKCKPK